jgi:KDO2-lipid IV(A) lauroyltransferase
MKILLHLIATCFRWMPRKVALFLGSTFGLFYSYFVSKRKEICRINIPMLLDPTWTTEKAIETLIKDMYKNMGKNMVEFLRLPLYAKTWNTRLFTVDGLEHWEAARAQGKPVIFVTAHLGFWDFVPVGLSLLGQKGCYVVKEMHHKNMHAFWEKYRDLCSVVPLVKKNSSSAILDSLKRKEWVGFIMDQNMNTDFGLFVQFGKKKACTLNAPALLARRYQLPVLAFFTLRQKDDTYRFIITPEIPQQRSNNLHEDLQVNTQRISDLMQAFILQYPEQWIWMHRRWKNQPQGSESLYPKKQKISSKQGK